MGARPRRRRRATPKRRLRRWLRRYDRLTRGLAIAVVAVAILVVTLAALRPNAEHGDTKIARRIPGSDSGSAAPARRAPTRRIPVQPHLKTGAPQPLPPQVPLAAPRTVLPVDDRFTGPRAAIVIDDLGQSLTHFEQLAELNIPLSIAVIPGLPASARTVREASRRGIEMLLHQPMEPREKEGKNLGAGILLTTMTSEALRAQVRGNLAAVPGAVGVNNHMGSRFTEDVTALGALMVEIKEHNLFWLDSRTTAGTRGVEAAQAAGVPALERDIFIDAEVNVDFIRRQVRKLIVVARAHGTAVAIGHPHPETIAILRELRGELLASGVTLVPVSALVQSSPGTGPGTALAAVLADKGAAIKPTLNRISAIP